VLAGRRGLPARRDWDSVTDPVLREQIEAVRGLEKLGATVRVLALDIADEQRAAAALDPAALGLPPVRGIVHAAGVTRDMLLIKTGRSALADVMRPKAAGAMVLHRLFPPGTLDFFVMFSSCGQFARVTGQAGYAAANAFLDALAASRGDAISFGWMAWHGMGMSGVNQAGMAEANARGLDAVSPDEAFRAWQFAERFDSPYFAVARVLPVPAPLPVLGEMLLTDDEPGQAESASPDALDGMTAGDLVDDLRAQVATELRMNAGDVNPRRPLPEMGVDSVLLVTLRARLLRRYGVDLPPTILWNQPTISALAAYLDDQRPG
jgi:acyl carrier protein